MNFYFLLDRAKIGSLQELKYFIMENKKGLPVYKASYDLLLESFKLVKDIRRDYRYTAGEKLKNEIIEMIMNIYRANKRAEGKLKRVKEAQENLEVIKILFRLLKDLNQISIDNFAKVSKQIDDVSRQLFGWHKSLKTKN